MKLEKWRNEIDAVDAEIVNLLERRAKIAREIGNLKTAAGLPVVDEAREDAILRNVAEKGGNVLKREALIRIFRSIIRESRLIQTQTKAKSTSGKAEQI